MLIQCLKDSAADLPVHYLDPRVNLDQSTRFPLTVGKDYVVYAVGFRQNQVWYYVCDDNELPYPMQYPAPLFRAVENSLSTYWRYGFTPDNEDHVAILGIEQWVLDQYFYDRLTDGNADEVATFQASKSLIDGEAARLDV